MRKVVIKINLQGNITPETLRNIKLPVEFKEPTAIMLNGRMPIWLAGKLLHDAHPAVYAGVFDPRIGYVITQSHNPQYKEGQVIETKDFEQTAETIEISL